MFSITSFLVKNKVLINKNLKFINSYFPKKNKKVFCYITNKEQKKCDCNCKDYCSAGQNDLQLLNFD